MVGLLLLLLLGHDDNAGGGMVAASSLVDASSTQAVAMVVVGAVAGSRRCRCLVDNAGGRRTTVGMGMGVIASLAIHRHRRWGW